MHHRWIFILTKDGHIIPEALLDKIMDQISMSDPEEYINQIMQGVDWLPAYRVAYNIKPNSIIVLVTDDGYHIFSEPMVVEEIRHALVRANTNSSWEIVKKLSEH